MIKYNSKKREKIIQLIQEGSLLTAKAICIRLPDIDKTTVYRAFTKHAQSKFENISEYLNGNRKNISKFPVIGTIPAR